MNADRITLLIERRFSQEDWAAEPYPLIPFDMPPGVGLLELHYSYSDPISADVLDQRPGNTVDLGLLGPDGFRGWSGSARQSISLSAGHATPGYLPGPLLPGRWHVQLGLYKLAPQGCVVRIEIELGERKSGITEADDLAPGPSSQASNLSTFRPSWDSLFVPVPDRSPGWYKGDLHCHSYHSEAEGSLEDVLAAARAQGLNFLAVTEHNTVSHLLELAAWAEPPSPLIIPSVELTTYHGHANAFGIRRWHDFRCRSAAQMAALRAEVQASGALFSINHPKMTGPPWEWGDEGLADAIEVWQHPWPLFNYQSLMLWDGLLRQGHRIVAVGGSDKHQPLFDGSLGYHEIGTPATWLYVDELSVPGLLAGLGAGHAFISAGPAGPRLELAAESAAGAAMMGDTLALATGETAVGRCRVNGAAGYWLRLVSAAGKQEIPIQGEELRYEWTAVATDLYWRAEVVEPPPAHQRDDPAAQHVVSLSNPIYLV